MIGMAAGFTSESAVEALNEATHRFDPPEIMNTDQATQFTSFLNRIETDQQARRVAKPARNLSKDRGVAHLRQHELNRVAGQLSEQVA
ncbi:MAG: hypothetical protein EOQ28_34145 [Mesorhizobium sp.]|uniref:hypothetical protein n=1 Tax=Mesorhizobium sp. TaxID=1871066 RepID=UPI000FE932F6|nr:hypothetical protein [Mesorhizobium sp.]RWA58102.1 MAG: hypothetical protein EOQ28_34145 [Mesorhizobium sp.]